MKKILLEGRYDSSVTNLSRILLGVIKDSYTAVTNPSGEFAGEKIYFKQGERVPTIDDDAKFKHIYFEEVENDNIPLEFYLTLKVQWIDGLNDLRKGGDAFNDDKRDSDELPLIEIRFEIDPAEYPNVLSEIAMELRDTLRHEIEHITQSGWNLKAGKYMQSDQSVRNKIQQMEIPTYRYFTLPKEIDANMLGLYFQAKKERKPFSTVINNYLNAFVSDTQQPGTMSSQEKEKVLTIWRKRLPALNLPRF